MHKPLTTKFLLIQPAAVPCTDNGIDQKARAEKASTAETARVVSSAAAVKAMDGPEEAARWAGMAKVSTIHPSNAGR